jgi:hypothetical protein
MKSAESKTAPARLIQSGGKIHYTLNATQATKPDGETYYRYDYVEIDPPVTREKIYAALKADDTEISAADAAGIDAEYALIDARLDEIGTMTWAQIDTHIDTVFAGLSVAQRNSLKMLYTCVLALVKTR